MTCGSCLHDNTLAAALLKLGEDVTLAPIYTPIRTDEPDVSENRVFFGSINVYLQQKWPLFRHTPRWLDRWLDHPALLNFLSGRAASVDPAKLGDLAVSMLRGESGNQHKELDKLVDWLLNELRPDVIHLSNCMMLGLARKIAQQGGPPVVCTLSGEDSFLEKLLPTHYSEARQLLRERAQDVSALVALNHYYADFMAEYLSVSRERVHVIPHGLWLEGHGQRDPTTPHRIGFLARVCPDKGLHLLVEACELLAQEQSLPPWELHAAGYLGADDRDYLRKLKHRTERGPLRGRFTYHGELDRAEKIAFLQSLTLFSTPTIYRESKGLPALEALANGVPIVVPDHGAFPELINDTGGGLLCRPESPPDLAEKIVTLLKDSQLAKDYGEAGQQAVHSRYHAEAMAQQTRQLYEQLLHSRNS